MSDLLLHNHPHAAKGYRGGTHRLRSPAETLARMRPLMREFGITRLANISGLDEIGLPVVAAIRPNGATVSTSLGKGLDLEAAMVSALMESIETWHAENVDRPLRLHTFAQLRSRGICVDPGALPRRGLPPSEHALELWIEGDELIGGTRCWVPFPAVSLIPGMRRGFECITQDTNGLASGNHPLEALVHGLCEVIERDALVLWRGTGGLHQLPYTRRVALASIDDPDCRRVLAAIEAAGLAVGVWDITSDVGIPTFVCLMLEPPDSGRLRVMSADMGSGTHLSPRVALLRALTEAVQARVTFVAGSRDNLTREDYVRARSPELQRATWQALREGEPGRRFHDIPELSTATFEGDVRVLVDGLQAAGLTQVVAVDISHERLGVPVIKVIVPGLESIHAPPRARAHRFWAEQKAR